MARKSRAGPPLAPGVVTQSAARLRPAQEVERVKRTYVFGLIAAMMIAAPPSYAARARFQRMVVVGDSILAGFGSGGFVNTGPIGQTFSAPAYVARRAGVSLPQPLMTKPGVPAPLVIDDVNGNGQLDPGEVRRTTDAIGTRARPIRVARNLAVPGEDLSSVFDEISPGVIAKNLFTGDQVDGRDVLKFLVLGVPPRDGSVSQVTRAQDLDPSFVMLWIGNNDVLDMATQTNPDAVTLDPSQFDNRFRRLLNALADTNAGMAVANLPDVTGIAALRHAGTEVTTCRQADGTSRAVAPDDLLSIDLPRSELPVPPCSEILGPVERDRIRATIMSLNAVIAAAVADTEQRRGVAIAQVDTFTLFDQLRSQGFDVDGNGTADISTGYLGGIFSLDGIHPTRTGNALIANAFIDAIDQRFGETIPRVDIARVAARDPLVGNRFRPAGEPPFGLIGDDDTNDLSGFFSDASDRVSNGAKSYRSDTVGTGKDLFGRIKRFFKDLF
jgi:lysophospholipase L1-like esterase